MMDIGVNERSLRSCTLSLFDSDDDDDDEELDDDEPQLDTIMIQHPAAVNRIRVSYLLQ